MKGSAADSFDLSPTIPFVLLTLVLPYYLLDLHS